MHLSKTSYSTAFLVLLYFTISFVGIVNHEIWLDEGHHWLLARDSNGLMDLINNTKNEGHPILWSILLFFVSRFTSNPFWMQFLHILLSTTAVFIFLKKAPFSILFKSLFIFGYFMVYEYNIISRNYVVGLLFLFIACNLFKDRDKNFTLLCLFLALAVNTHLIFGVIGFAFFLTLLFENYGGKIGFLDQRFLKGYSIFILGLVISIIQIVPFEEINFFDHTRNIPLQEKFTTGFISFFKGMVPIPDFRSLHFWNSNLLVNLSKPIAGVLGILVYFIPLLLFYKRKIILFFVYTSLFGTQVFFFVTQLSATRYFGMTFIIMIIALWLDNLYPSKQAKPSSSPFLMVKKPIIFTFLIIQVIAGGIAFWMDIQHPFSNGKDVVEFLEEKGLSNHMVVTPFCEGTIISPYLGKKVYFLCSDRFQSYCDWNSNCDKVISKQTIFEKLSKIRSEESMILILSDEILNLPKNNSWYNMNKKLKIKYLTKLNTYVIRNLDYTIYEISRVNHE